MSFDALTLAAIRDEIEPRLVGGRIQRLAVPDASSLALELFAPGAGRAYLLLSAHPEHGRVQLVPGLPARGDGADTPFSLLARKHLRNARLRSIRQPRLERVLELEGEQRDDSGQHHRMLLIVEAMGRRSNLVLVGPDGAILDALRRSPPSRNPRRPVLPHLRYAPPPPQARLAPERLAPGRLAELAGARGGTLAGFLQESLAGLSPLASKELAFRATGALDAPLSAARWDAVVGAARALLAPLDSHAWEPVLATRGGQPLAFAPYPLTHLAAGGAALERRATMSDALTAFYERAGATAPARGDPLAAERRALLAPLASARRAIERRVAALEQQLGASAQRDALRRAGEAILAHQWELRGGQDGLEADGERIALDAGSTPVENARRYFARYRKAREAAERVPELLEAARRSAAHLDELSALVEVAETMEAVRALRREVAAATGAPPPRRSAGPAGRGAGPYQRVALGQSWEALVGASAAGNAKVTFELARPDDLWLHARGVPGAHVVVRGGRAGEPPPEVLARAAGLAAWHSAARSAGQVEVDYVRRRHVRKVPHGPPGLVRYANAQTIRVAARAATRHG